MRLRLSLFVALMVVGKACLAQVVPGFQKNPDPFQVSFAEAWSTPLDGKVKLIESASILHNDTQSLIELLAGPKPDDPRRTVVVAHWDGFRFATDTSFSFLGWEGDPLMCGRFVLPVVSPPIKGAKKKPEAPITHQLLVASGIYAWTGGAFEQICPCPPQVKLAIIHPPSPSLLLGGVADATQVWEAGETQYKPVAYQLTPSEDSYLHYGIGTQKFRGEQDFLPHTHPVQVWWNSRERWFICVQSGSMDPKRPDMSTGDEVVVYIPRARNRDRTFWELTSVDDYLEGWRSAALPGHVLDVRIGDPKNNGHIGMLVLLEDPETSKRTLLFYSPTELHKIIG